MISCCFEDGGKAKLRHACVDTLVLNDNNQILLVKRAPGHYEGGKWGTVGGFMDFDETLTQAAEREVYEETGYRIKNIIFMTIIDNPHRPNDDRQNISFVYFCQAGEKTGEPDDESTEQRWFDLDNLPPQDQIAFDHADNIKLYKRYLKGEIQLPFFDFG